MFNPEDRNATPDARRLPTPDRRLSVTPLDLRQARFPTALRGFTRTDVTAFLEEAAESFEQALRENERLRMEIVRLEASINQFRELEGGLKTTLMSAQKIADDMRENATKEADRIVREAEGRAKLLLQKAQSRVEDVVRDIDGLRLKRREVETGIEATISTLQSTLDFVREQEQREDRVVSHRPRIEVATRPA